MTFYFLLVEGHILISSCVHNNYAYTCKLDCDRSRTHENLMIIQKLDAKQKQIILQ